MRPVLLVSALPLLAIVLGVPGVSLYFEGNNGRNCTGCHEMQPQYELWTASSHRSIDCGKCHGSALTADTAFHETNVRRAIGHMRGDLPERILMTNRQVQAMTAQCKTCHRQEYAAWAAGPHGSSYARIFLDSKHNGKILLIDDCLRCHGMHFEGGIAQVVTPISRTGPWQMARAELGEMPSMPCIACHQVHREGPEQKKGMRDTKPLLAFFDRRSQTYVPVTDLPIPSMQDGARAIRMSPDPRQALCYQCHAPMSTMQAGSGDDRTPMGVHEGISCLGCHDTHGQQTRRSCASCHPRLSNCGLDVEQMDTSFRSTDSRHNIHWVKCVDCHPAGVPRPRQKSSLSANWN